MDLGLKGKVAIVTGGATGIGRGCVEGFVKEGAAVVIADIQIDKAQKLAEKLSSDKAKVLAIKTDVGDWADASNCASKAMQEFGKIDILVHNAGIGVHSVDFVEMPEEQWQEFLKLIGGE